jgi:hypothetical protein
LFVGDVLQLNLEVIEVEIDVLIELDGQCEPLGGNGVLGEYIILQISLLGIIIITSPLGTVNMVSIK